MKKPLVLLLLLLSFQGVAHADEPVRFDFAFEQDSSVPIVNISVAFRRGFANDPADLPGLTYFMGEMLSKGTKLRTKSQLELKMDELGSSIGIDVRSEFMAIRGSVLSSNLKPFLELLTEVILHPSFPDSEASKLKQKLKSEIIALRGNDSALARRASIKFLFGNHPYGRVAYGTLASIPKFNRARLQKHYLETFSGDNMIVAGTGDTDAATLMQWARSLDQALPKKVVSTPLPTPVAPKKTRLLIVDKADRTQVPIIASQLGITFEDPDFFALHLGNTAFGSGTFASRLMEEIRVKRSWSYGAGSGFQFGSQPREWSLSYSPRTETTAEALKFGIQMVKDLKEKGLTPEEFAFTKDSLVNSAGFMYNTPDRRIENTLIEKAFHLPDGFFKSYSDKVQKLTLEEVNASLKKFLHPEALSIVAVGPAKDLKKALAAAVGIPEKEVVVKPYTAE